MNKVFPTGWLSADVCNVNKGICKIPETCANLLEKFTNEGEDFSLSFTLNGLDDTKMIVSLPWQEMLIEPRKSEVADQKKACYLPIYGLKREDQQKWILGKIIM